MIKRLLTLLLTLSLSLTILPMTSMTTHAATNAKVGSSNYCTVTINQSLINKRGKQYAKVKLKTYSVIGWYNTGAKVKITLKDGNNRYVCSWTGRGGDTLKLGDDHRTYRIYVDYYNQPTNRGFLSNIINSGNNFVNQGAAHKWTISDAKNCTIR